MPDDESYPDPHEDEMNDERDDLIPWIDNEDGDTVVHIDPNAPDMK